VILPEDAKGIKFEVDAKSGKDWDSLK